MLERTTLFAALLLGGSLLAPDAAAQLPEPGGLELSVAVATPAAAVTPAAEASAQRARGGSGGSRSGARPQSGGSSGSRGGARPSSGQRSGGSRPSPSTSGGSSRGRSSSSPSPSSRGRSVAPPRSSNPRPAASPSSRPSVSPGSSSSPGSTSRPSSSAPRTYVSPSTPSGEASAPRPSGSSSGSFPSGGQSGPSGIDTRYSPTGSGGTPTGSGSTGPGPGSGSGQPSAGDASAGLIDLRSARSAPRVRFPAPYRPAGSSRGPAGERGTPSSVDLSGDPSPGGSSDGPHTGGGSRPTLGSSGGPAIGGSGRDGGRRGLTPGPASLRGLAPRPGADGPGSDGGPSRGGPGRPTLGGAGQDGPRLSGGSRGKLGRTEYSAGPTGRTRPGGERGKGSGSGLRPVGLDDARPRGRVAPRPDDHGRDHGHGHHGYYGPGYWYGYRPSYCSPWGYGYGSGLCFWWGYGYHGHHWGWWYWPFYLSCWTPIWYTHTQVVYVEDDDPEVIYVEVERAPEPVGEAVAYPQVVETPAEPAPTAPGTVPESVHIATQRYLDLGDRAFREGRYPDAIQFYARAVSLSPDEAGLHLVLADALFAAGDYHYAAFSIRRALELEPTLAESQVDKHDFYADPAAFDRQLAVLETHVEGDPADADARLVLALNYLFGKRPAAAVDLLERGVAPSAVLGPDPAVGIVLEAARKAQFGR